MNPLDLNIGTLLNNNKQSIIHWFCYFSFFNSSGSISDMIVLIAFITSALLLYCFLPSCNFIFTIDHRFSIAFRLRLISPVNLMHTEFTGKLRCMRRSLVMHKYTFETARLEVTPCKTSFVHKNHKVNTIQFHSFDFKWSKNNLADNFSPL